MVEWIRKDRPGLSIYSSTNSKERRLISWLLEQQHPNVWWKNSCTKKLVPVKRSCLFSRMFETDFIPFKFFPLCLQ